MDDMSLGDIMLMTKYLEYADVNLWSMTRELMLCSIAPYTKKKNLTAQELWPLPCDPQKPKLKKTVTNEEIEAFNKNKEFYQSLFKNNKGEQ